MKFIYTIIYLYIVSVVFSVAYADKYDAAKDAAFRAAFIQTGAQDFQSRFIQYFENKSKLYIYRLGLEKPLAVGLYCSQVYMNETLTLPISSGKEMKLKLNEISVRLRFDF